MENVILSQGDEAAIARAASQAHPSEACGLLYGVRGGRSFKVQDVEVLQNDEQQHPDRLFRISPEVLLNRHKAARKEGRNIIGHFHSHPSGYAAPSETDRQNITDPMALWLIYGLSDDGRARLNAFIPTSGGADFKALEVHIVRD